MAIDSAGNVYIANQSANKVYKETLSSGIYTQSIIASGFLRAYEVAVDSHGNLFVADANAGKVFLLTPPVTSGGNYTQTLVTNDGAFGLTVDASDNVIVVANDSKVYKETYVAAGSYAETTLVTPSGCSYATSVAVDTNSNLYIACNGNNKVVKETPAGGGSYSQSSIGSGLSNPSGVAVDAIGNVYIADQTKNRVLLETLSSGSYTQSTIYNGSYISDVGFDSSGTLYVANTGDQQVIKQTTGTVNFGSVNIRSTGSIPLTFMFDTGGTLASTAVLTQGATGLDFQDAGNDTCSASTSYTAGASCVLNVQFSPKYSGIRYGAVTLNDSTGAAIATANIIGTGSGPQIVYSPPMIGTLGSGFSYPQGVAVNGRGDVFVADSVNHAVKRIVASGGVVSGSSMVKTVGSGFSTPSAVAVDGSGDVFVADSGNSTVKEIVAVGGGVSSSSTVNTVGSGFSGPYGVAVDGSGDIFVADYVNNAVKEIVAGTGGAASGTVNSTPR